MLVDDRKDTARKTKTVYSDLRSTEAESRQFSVGLLWVNHQQAFLFIQTQVPACGDVANTERLTPFHVATTPAVEEKIQFKTLYYCTIFHYISYPVFECRTCIAKFHRSLNMFVYIKEIFSF